MSQPIIECTNLTHRYDGAPVLHDLTMSISGGKIVGLLGKNGAGKSTTINILMGFLQPMSGSCSVFGHPSHAIPAKVRRDIGLLHEGFIQYDFMSIAEIERFHARLYPAWNKDWYYELINRINVPHSRRVNRLSCGQRSQVVLGLILAQQPKLMILDDYSMGLDVGYRRLFIELLRDYVAEQKIGVLLTSHVVQELETLIDEMIILQEGKVLIEGSVQEVLGNFYQYDVPLSEATQSIKADQVIVNIERHATTLSLYTHMAEVEFAQYLTKVLHCSVPFTKRAMNLEDAFIGLTGRY